MKLVRTLVLCSIVVAAAVAGGKLAFTANNAVAASQVGDSVTAITTADKAPEVCRANDVDATKLIVSSSSTVYGTGGSDLILGTRNWTQTLKGGGGKDCIVAGSVPYGKTITLAPAYFSGSVCVKGPGPGSYAYGFGCAVRA